MTAMPHQNPDTARYALVITDDGQLLNNTVHATRGERRDACVEVLKDACNDVTKAEVNDILLTFGGADPDAAIGSISALYADFGVDVYLEDQAVPEEPVTGVPVAMYSVLQSYENSAQNTIAHFPTKEARTEHLRKQLVRLIRLISEVPSDESFSDTELATHIERRINDLIDQRVTVHMVTSFAPNWL
ncbi:hypothetical protein [Arthrobacter sp. ES1]|uniref:hypothetical protein n=1 Tax=Arthrobacter sp. ES1 TaxID=1897056 RepID=UPI001CFF8A23|nr:hypothetical protein [Arthrobacter sp. ES1]MCB5280645.1 hypothetical protein [Arthrobacter sp. ES1]